MNYPIKQKNDFSCAAIALMNLENILGGNISYNKDYKVFIKSLKTDKDGTSDANIERVLHKITSKYGAAVEKVRTNEFHRIAFHFTHGGFGLISHLEMRVDDPEPHIALFLDGFSDEEGIWSMSAINLLGKIGETVCRLTLEDLIRILSRATWTRTLQTPDVDYWAYLIHLPKDHYDND